MSAHRIVVALVVVLTLTIGSPRPAGAHAGVESSAPASGETVASPVSEIVIRFTTPISPVESGFEVLTPGGQVVAPTARSDDGSVWTLELNDAYDGGVMAVRFVVLALDDGHVLTDGFSFRVGPTAAATTTPQEPSGGGAADPGSEERADEFLEGIDRYQGPEAAAGIGRRLGFVAVLVTVGLSVLAFGLVSDRPSEVSLLLTIIAFLASGQFLGSALEAYGLVRLSNEPMAGALRSEALVSPLLRLIASLLILPVGWVAGRPATGAETGDVRSVWWQAAKPAALTGLAIGVLSFGFDGHTRSEGPRFIHALSNAVHVTAAGVWLGGLVGLAILLRGRAVGGRPGSATSLVVRFSSIAAVALGGVAVAGGTMAFFVLDRWGDLLSTPWGRRLMIKVGLVAIVVGVAIYNHVKALPALRHHPDDHVLVERARLTIAVEAAILLVVAIVAASMAAASTA